MPKLTRTERRRRDMEQIRARGEAMQAASANRLALREAGLPEPAMTEAELNWAWGV